MRCGQRLGTRLTRGAVVAAAASDWQVGPTWQRLVHEAGCPGRAYAAGLLRCATAQERARAQGRLRAGVDHKARKKRKEITFFL